MFGPCSASELEHAPFLCWTCPLVGRGFCSERESESAREREKERKRGACKHLKSWTLNLKLRARSEDGVALTPDEDSLTAMFGPCSASELEHASLSLPVARAQGLLNALPVSSLGPATPGRARLGMPLEPSSLLNAPAALPASPSLSTPYSSLPLPHSSPSPPVSGAPVSSLGALPISPGFRVPGVPVARQDTQDLLRDGADEEGGGARGGRAGESTEEMVEEMMDEQDDWGGGGG